MANVHIVVVKKVKMDIAGSVNKNGENPVTEKRLINPPIFNLENLTYVILKYQIILKTVWV